MCSNIITKLIKILFVKKCCSINALENQLVFIFLFNFFYIWFFRQKFLFPFYETLLICGDKHTIFVDLGNTIKLFRILVRGSCLSANFLVSRKTLLKSLQIKLGDVDSNFSMHGRIGNYLIALPACKKRDKKFI